MIMPALKSTPKVNHILALFKLVQTLSYVDYCITSTQAGKWAIVMVTP